MSSPHPRTDRKGGKSNVRSAYWYRSGRYRIGYFLSELDQDPQLELDDLLAERERLNMQLQEILDKSTDPWGIKVTMMEVKHVDLPPEMQRAIAKQAEAEREKRAKVIHAEGEYLASKKQKKT
jgi:regulator of protease activity HflC (stomatin/prohibitin superfamily)